jgi:hypothetical protein
MWVNASLSPSSHAATLRSNRPRDAITFVRSSTISPASSISYSVGPTQYARSAGRQAWMPLRQGSTGACTHAPGSSPGSGQRNLEKTVEPSARKNL